MRKLLFITFICSSLCAYAQSEIPEDTIKNRPPVKKEQIPFSPKKRTSVRALMKASPNKVCKANSRKR